MAGSILLPRTPWPSGDREPASGAGRGAGCEPAAGNSVERTSTMSKINSGVAPHTPTDGSADFVCNLTKTLLLDVLFAEQNFPAISLAAGDSKKPLIAGQDDQCWQQQRSSLPSPPAQVVSSKTLVDFVLAPTVADPS